MSDNEPLLLGRDNSAASWTILRRTAPPGEFDPLEALIIDNPHGSGVLASVGFGPGILGESPSGPGIFGRSTSPGGHGGVQGFNLHGPGVVGLSQDGVGVRGIATQGLFEGIVLVQGAFATDGPALVTETLSAGAIQAQSKMFRIDHPLDPANKYLIHTSVESPDMKNVYDGLVTLDAQGEATVELPEWFEALNTNLRYQLTPIGSPGPNLHVAEEVSNKRFKIGGGAAGIKVSWQVTGIRKDSWAEAHRNPVEQEKPPEERGLYLHPELYGDSSGRRLGWAALEEHHRRRREYARRSEADSVKTEALMPNQEQLLEEHRRWVDGLEQP
jgi:hypothetical protein